MVELNNGNKKEELEKEILRRGEQIRKSEERYRALFDNMIDGFALLKIELDDNQNPADYQFFEVNSAFERMLDLRKEDIMGKRATEIFSKIEGDPHIWIEKVKQIALNGGEIRFEVYLKPIGKWFSITAYSTEKGYSAIILEDITERKQKEEELKRSLKDRELLFRELKHRVKNNMQLLSSMMSLQSMQTENETVLKKLQEVQSVIKTMSLVYSRAYEGPRINELNLKSFIEELVVDIMKFKIREDIRVDYCVEGEEIKLNTDQAIPMALIANELIFNSIKHAFTGKNEGLISISLKEQDNNISMAIRDNGVGIAPDIDLRKPGTLGLKIVKDLTEQLQGNIEILNGNGTGFIIKVPKEEVI
jgi:PAS domain S-box-containing protein